MENEDAKIAATVIAVVALGVSLYLMADGLIGLYRLTRPTKMKVTVIDTDGKEIETSI